MEDLVFIITRGTYDAHRFVGVFDDLSKAMEAYNEIGAYKPLTNYDGAFIDIVKLNEWENEE